jgi:hypothetical protein
MADFTLNAPGTVNNPWVPANILVPFSTLSSTVAGFHAGSAGTFTPFSHNATYGTTITTTVTMEHVNSGGDDWCVGAMVNTGANAGNGIYLYVLPTSCVLCTIVGASFTKTNISAALTITAGNTDVWSVTMVNNGTIWTFSSVLQNGSPLTFSANTTSTYAAEPSMAASGAFVAGNSNGTFFSQFTGTGVAGGGAMPPISSFGIFVGS